MIQPAFEECLFIYLCIICFARHELIIKLSI